MNRVDLINTLKEKSGISRKEATAVVEIVFNEMANALSKGERVEIRGFCSMFVKKYNGYTGRNPRTGEQAFVKPKKLPSFRCGAELRERVDS